MTREAKLMIAIPSTVLVGFLIFIVWRGDRHPWAGYNPTRICDDSYQKNENHSEDAGNYFDVPLRNGCFGGIITPPKRWNNWHAQPVGEPFWAGFWFVGDDRGRNPILGNFDNIRAFNASYATPFRLQGQGTIRFYSNASVADTPKSSPTPASYQARFCDDNADQKMDGDSLIVTLKEGCFAGPIVITGQFYNVDKSQHEGDWAAMWCNGREHPSKVHPAYEDFGDDDFRRCSKFYLQGRGTVHVTKLK